MVLAWHWGSASPRSQPRTEVMRRGQHPRATPRRSHPRPPSLLWGTDATGSLFGNRCHQLGGSDSAAATCEPRSGTRCCTNCHMALVAPASLPRPHSAPAPLCSELQRGHGRSLPSGSGPPQGTAGRTALTPEDVHSGDTDQGHRKAPLGTVTTCHPLAASRAPSDHTVHLALLGAFMWWVWVFFLLFFFFSFLFFSFFFFFFFFFSFFFSPQTPGGIPCYQLFSCHDDPSFPEGRSGAVHSPSCTPLELLLTPCRGDQRAPSWNPLGILQEGTWNNHSLPFSGAFQQRISKHTDPEANQAGREQLAGQRRDENGPGGMGRSCPGGTRSGLTPRSSGQEILELCCTLALTPTCLPLP
ncbi:uncharacterized protein LOC134557452 isoform X1 [Prinia subflava]|uniref:uncharacterized protein LOC134557452 isoform X1 n=1 Tax=Prinia subflava TaxID=208062 RepID=UPI002FDF4D84